jgi:hypothetical protein
MVKAHEIPHPACSNLWPLFGGRSDFRSPSILISGSVVSMLLVLVLLSTKLLKEQALGESADFMLRNMTFFFIPPG